MNCGGSLNVGLGYKWQQLYGHSHFHSSSYLTPFTSIRHPHFSPRRKTSAGGGHLPYCPSSSSSRYHFLPVMSDTVTIHIDPVDQDIFLAEVDNVKRDLKNVENLYTRLQELNGEIREAEDAKTVKDLREQFIADLDFQLNLAKRIKKKFVGLLAANAAQRRFSEGAGSDDDRKRAAMIADLLKSLKRVKHVFQGTKVQMEMEHRQQIETRYSAITGEKATAEAIEKLIANQKPDDATENVISEIVERSDTLKDIRRSLLALQEIFAGIVIPTPAERRTGGYLGSVGRETLPTTIRSIPAAEKTGNESLKDYQKSMRKQAYIASAVALVILVALIFSFIRFDKNMNKGIRS